MFDPNAFPVRSSNKNGKQSKALPDLILLILTLLFHIVGLSNEDMEILTRAAKEKSGNPLDDRGNFKQVGIMTMPKTINSAYDTRKPKHDIQRMLKSLGYVRGGQMDLDIMQDKCMAKLIEYIGYNPLGQQDAGFDEDGEAAVKPVSPDDNSGDGTVSDPKIEQEVEQPKRGRNK
jgi:hypothetical protein